MSAGWRLWLGRGLMVCGALTVAAVVALIGLAGYKIVWENEPAIDRASVRDVRYVLNWCELGEGRIEKVVHSYVSPRSMTGDHLDAYAIKISRLELKELTDGVRLSDPRWFRGDNAPPVLSEAMRFMGMFLRDGEIPWFPGESDLRTADYYVYPFDIRFHGVDPTAAELIFVRPADRMVFFFSGKT